MSLADRLKDAGSGHRPGLPCRLGSLLRGKEIQETDKEYLLKVLDTPPGDPRRVPTTSIAEALRLEGHNIGVAAVQRHRRRECRCYGPSPKFEED